MTDAVPQVSDWRGGLLPDVPAERPELCGAAAPGGPGQVEEMGHLTGLCSFRPILPYSCPRSCSWQDGAKLSQALLFPVSASERPPFSPQRAVGSPGGHKGRARAWAFCPRDSSLSQFLVRIKKRACQPLPWRPGPSGLKLPVYLLDTTTPLPWRPRRPQGTCPRLRTLSHASPPWQWASNTPWQVPAPAHPLWVGGKLRPALTLRAPSSH